MRKLASRLAVSVLGLSVAASAQAATVTGQLTSSLVLINSCQVNGSVGSSGLNFGALNFGTTTSLFTSANAQVLGSGGGAMSILCAAGVIPVVKIRAGAHDGQSIGGTRALADGSGNFVAYDLYTDAGTTQRLVIDATITLPTSSGVQQTVNLYGRAVGKAGLPAGTYTDTISVELTF